ncbi:MAG: carbonic anhydrase [Verrucomicrobia bacterium]|nr:MAG: carbonic anhydrase [Verrucomicrobiota bacterium]
MSITSKHTLIIFLSLFSLAALVFAADYPTPSVSTEAALANLKEGNARFATHEVSQGKPNAAKRAETAQTQRPFAIVVACADSRTSPELIFDHNIGDLFVVRTAGNLVDDYGLGSIEYSVNHLGARLIVVVGHDGCGAVKAALTSDTAPGHIESLVRGIQPAIKAVKGKEGDPLHLAITKNARLMADKIRSQTDFGELAKEVRIVFGVYDLTTGKVDWGKD